MRNRVLAASLVLAGVLTMLPATSAHADPTPLHVVARIDLPAAFPTGVVVDSSARRAYVISSLPPRYPVTLSVINTNSNTVIDHYDIPVVRRVNNSATLALDADWHRLFVSDGADDTITVINSRTGKMLTTMSDRHVSHGIAVDPATHNLWALNNDNTVTVYSIFGTELSSASVDNIPANIAFNPDNHHAYSPVTHGAEGFMTNRLRTASLPFSTLELATCWDRHLACRPLAEVRGLPTTPIAKHFPCEPRPRNGHRT